MNHEMNTQPDTTVAVRRSRRTAAARPEAPSSPSAPAAPRRRRGLGVLAGAVLGLVLLTGCNLPVERWVPDFNGDGRIDETEVARQKDAISQIVAVIDAERRAVQAHPFLSCVRAHESKGNYAVQNPRSTASGAYQFLDSTWRNVSASAGHGGYARASQAPWWVQDAVALWLVNSGGRSAWNGTGC
ncbi:MAG TPA: transglycosylase family protein [Microthrixaceae bacterium]|nr:transglycosylase family protein [Microthrixaceae bacterium]